MSLIAPPKILWLRTSFEDCFNVDFLKNFDPATCKCRKARLLTELDVMFPATHLWASLVYLISDKFDLKNISRALRNQMVLYTIHKPTWEIQYEGLSNRKTSEA